MILIIKEISRYFFEITFSRFDLVENCGNLYKITANEAALISLVFKLTIHENRARFFRTCLIFGIAKSIVMREIRIYFKIYIQKCIQWINLFLEFKWTNLKIVICFFDNIHDNVIFIIVIIRHALYCTSFQLTLNLNFYVFLLFALWFAIMYFLSNSSSNYISNGVLPFIFYIVQNETFPIMCI